MGGDTKRHQGDRGGKAFAERMAVVGRAEGRRGRDDTGLLLQLQRAPTPPGESVKTPIQTQEAKVGPPSCISNMPPVLLMLPVPGQALRTSCVGRGGV